jgi:hypothetical protein
VDSPDLARTATVAGPATTPGAELPEGMRLGHFRIERKLGAGGMGEVYLATDLALDRPVAIKVLPANSSSGSARDRLIREARAQARVQHSNVAHIYFIGEDAGRLYFAMEYIAGTTLADRVASGPMPVDDALALTRAAVLGLREAQRSGFTHRDVKPSNLMVDPHGTLKVLDFGLAAGSPERVGDGPVAQTTLAGTPLYMAPEQSRGEPVDFRADVYALGATLYHLVSGKPPFVAESVHELLSLHASAARPAVPRGKSPRTRVAAVDKLVARMMAADPAKRFQSYDELLSALDAASLDRTRPAGFWVRGTASFIDLLLVGLLLGLVELGLSLLGREIHSDFVLWPIGLVYSVLAIKRFGATLGKALFELEVVAYPTGERPTWRHAIVRQAVEIGPVMFGSIVEQALRETGVITRGWPSIAMKVFGGVVMVGTVGVLLYASLRVVGKRAPWDRLSGTMVRYRTTRRT